MTPAEVRALRVRMGLSQEAFAKRLGVSVNTVTRWERGVMRPKGLSLVALKRLLG